MPPQQPHFPQRNDPAPDETPTIAPVFPPTFPSTFPPRFPPAPSPALDPAPLPPLDKSPTGAPTRAHAPAPTSAPTPARPATRPPSRRIARPTVPIQPPTLPGLEDDIRAADAEVRSEARSRALVPAASPVTLAPTRGNGGESTALLIRGAARPPRPAANVVPRRSGPRSFLTQFLVAMLASAVLVSTLALTTPLGQNIAEATNSRFTTSAGAFIQPPTPTPTATPKPKFVYPSAGNDPGKQAIINDIIAVFGDSYAQGALNIAKCESGYDPNARNTYPIGNSHASGVFQILYPSTWNTTSYAAYSPFDYDKNIHAAYEIFRRDGYSWREWACKSY